jgi:hypothetical protein
MDSTIVVSFAGGMAGVRLSWPEGKEVKAQWATVGQPYFEGGADPEIDYNHPHKAETHPTPAAALAAVAKEVGWDGYGDPQDYVGHFEYAARQLEELHTPPGQVESTP